MIHSKNNFSVSIRSGLNGPIMTEYDTEPSPTTVCIEAVTGTILCPQITIPKDFNWHEAHGLFVAIRYGSKPYQLEFWVPKPSASSLDEEEDWSFQIPGKNVLDTASNQPVGYEYRFADLEISDCDNIYCHDLKGNIDHYIGSIWVSVRRKKVKTGLTPTSIASHTPPHPPQKVCPRSAAVTWKGVRHTVEPRQIAPLDMGTMVSDPKPEAFLDLEKPEGHWMNSVFFFRPRERLPRLMNRKAESELVRSHPGQNTQSSRIPHSGLNVAISEPSTGRMTHVPTFIMHTDKKRRGAQSENQIGAGKTSSPLDTSHQHKRPRRDVVMRSSDPQRGSVGLHSSVDKPHQAPDDARNGEDETEDVDGDREREQLLTAFTKQASQTKSSAKDCRNLTTTNLSHCSKPSVSVHQPPSRTRPSKPDLSSVLTEEYRKLREASNANRRLKQKNKHTPKAASISSNQSTESFTLRASIPETQFASMDQITPPQEDDGSDSTESSRLTSLTPAEERVQKPSASDLEIKTLRAKKARLQEQLKLKLKAECEELERQLNE